MHPPEAVSIVMAIASAGLAAETIRRGRGRQRAALSAEALFFLGIAGVWILLAVVWD